MSRGADHEPSRPITHRLVTALVHLYPPAFQRRFGAELSSVIAQALADPGHRTARVAADLLAGALAEWWLVLGHPASAADWRRVPVWPRLRGASPQRTAPPPDPPFSPLPGLRRRHGVELPTHAPTRH